MDSAAKINEIFGSIQGEGPIVGYRQIFIRFCGCNLNCKYCDTEFNSGIVYSVQNLYKKLASEYDFKTFHSVSLTGGEPLLSADFLEEFLPLIKNDIKIYLETNATLVQNFEKIKKYVDIVGADIKLPSATGINVLALNEEFFEKCRDIQTFAKIVFNENITSDEIEICTNIGEKTNIELVLQPEMQNDKIRVSSDFCGQILEKFAQKYPRVRLIAQMHKFIEVQ